MVIHEANPLGYRIPREMASFMCTKLGPICHYTRATLWLGRESEGLIIGARLDHCYCPNAASLQGSNLHCPKNNYNNKNENVCCIDMHRICPLVKNNAWNPKLCTAKKWCSYLSSSSNTPKFVKHRPIFCLDLLASCKKSHGHSAMIQSTNLAT